MASIANARMSNATVTLGGVSVGHTLDGVEFSLERSFEDIKVDQYGDMPVDKILTGSMCTIKFKLAEVLADNFNNAIPEGQHLSGTEPRVGFGTDAGYSLRADAKQLVLHPIDKASGDNSEDVTIYKAVSVGTVVANYKYNEQRVIEVEMVALVDETYGNGRRLGHIGGDVS